MEKRSKHFGASWRSATHEEGADTDDAPEPERRDDQGDAPPAVVEGPAQPFAEQDEFPAGRQPAAVVVELVAPVEITAARSWAPNTATILLVPVRIVNADPDRLSVTVTNRGAGDCYIAPSEAALQGAPTRISIETDESRTFTHRAEIWCVSAASSAVETISERR